jgi:hypothetical protein
MSLKDFIGGLLALGAVIAFILVIGFAGAIEQDIISFSDGVKRILICVGTFIILGGMLYLLCKDDKED